MEITDRLPRTIRKVGGKAVRLLMVPALLTTLASSALAPSSRERSGGNDARIATILDEVELSSQQLIERFYPEALGIDYEEHRPEENVVFINFSEKKFNEDGISGLYRVYRNLVGYELDYSIEGEKYHLQIQERPSNQRVVFVVPQSLDPSSYAKEGFERYPKGFTQVAVDEEGIPVLGRVISYLIHQEGDKGGTLGRTLYTEICQSRLSVSVVSGLDQDLAVEERRKLRIRLQEVMCNSLGMAIYEASVGMDYDFYKEDMAHGGLTDPSGVKYPMMVLDEETFKTKIRLGAPIWAQ